MITIDKYLAEYREYMFTKDLIIKEIGSSNLSRSDLYVITEHSYFLIKSLLNSTIFLETSLIDIEKEIDDIYTHINSKLDKILELTEGYQKLNTSELLEEPIKGFSVFDIKKSENYNSFLEGLTLKNISKLRNKVPDIIDRLNKNSKEVYIFKEDSDGDLIQFKALYPTSNVLKTINMFDTDNSLIGSYQDFQMITLSKGVSRIEVLSDNETLNTSSFTLANIYHPYYQKRSSLKLDTITFKKEGSLFKLNTSYNIPTDCYITLKLTFSYKDITTGDLKQETVYSSIDNSRKVLVSQQEIDSLNKEYTKILDRKLLETDLIFINPMITDNTVIDLKGYNVFDISKINAKEFNVSIIVDLFNLADKNKTPLIEGIYGYVTK